MTILLFAGHFQDNLLDLFLECPVKENDKPFLKWACRMMETVAMEFSAKHGWSSLKRLST
jgi:hypothetical protein